MRRCAISCSSSPTGNSEKSWSSQYGMRPSEHSSEREFERYTFGYRNDGIAPIQNKVGAFIADPLLNRILTSSKSDIQVRGVDG